MKNWDKILADFARKCKGGAPDMTNPRHLALLRESLIKFGWNENAVNEFVGDLREGVSKKHDEWIDDQWPDPIIDTYKKKSGEMRKTKVSSALTYGLNPVKDKKKYKPRAYKKALMMIASKRSDPVAQEILASQDKGVSGGGKQYVDQKTGEVKTQTQTVKDARQREAEHQENGKKADEVIKSHGLEVGVLLDRADGRTDGGIKQVALTKGFKEKTRWTAPGNKGSMFNEIKQQLENLGFINIHYFHAQCFSYY